MLPAKLLTTAIGNESAIAVGMCSCVTIYKASHVTQIAELAIYTLTTHQKTHNDDATYKLLM